MAARTEKEELKAKRKEEKKAAKEAKKQKQQQVVDDPAPPASHLEPTVTEDSSIGRYKRKAEDAVEEDIRTSKKSKRASNGGVATGQDAPAPGGEKKKKKKRDKKATNGDAQANSFFNTDERVENDLDQDSLAHPKEGSPTPEQATTEQRKKAKEAKKLGKDTKDVDQDESEAQRVAKKLAKRERRAARKAEEAKNAEETKVTDAPETKEEADESKEVNGSSTENPGPDKRTRYILFVGNLPFKATKADLEKHFAKVKPLGVRLMTDQTTGKSRGFAFLDFENDVMARQCLKSYHHSFMSDGTAKGRQINVELTAGGGGNSKDRKAKIQTKNQGLHAQRQRRHEQEEKQKMRQEKKAQTTVKKANGVPNADSVADAPPKSGPFQESDMGIHPARLAQMRKRF